MVLYSLCSLWLKWINGLTCFQHVQPTPPYTDHIVSMKVNVHCFTDGDVAGLKKEKNYLDKLQNYQYLELTKSVIKMRGLYDHVVND